MNNFYFNVEVMTLSLALTYFYVSLKHFNVSGKHVSKQLEFLSYSWIFIFISMGYKVLIFESIKSKLLVQIISFLFITTSLYILYRIYKVIRTNLRDEMQMVYITIAVFLVCIGLEISNLDYANNVLVTFLLLALKIGLIVLIIKFFKKFQNAIEEKDFEVNFQNKKLTQAEIKILKLAYIDQVTLIPNNIAFQKDFNDSDYLNDQRLILLINLDDFKYVNNLIGFTKGNEYLKNVASLLKENLSSNDKVYSLSGDQFGIIHYGDKKSASELASLIIKKLNKSCDLSIKHCKIGASIGISNITLDHDYNKTMREVEIALLEVKNKGKNNYLYYDLELDNIYESKLMMENKLDLALIKNQFDMYFQPQVDLKTCKIVGLEALIRWIDEDGKFISPEEFIPLAEKSGKMSKISDFIMDESLKKLKSVIDNGYDDIKMSINVSAVEIFDECFVDRFIKRVKKYNINPNKINLEITETSLIENVELASEIFIELKQYQISISLDDFGVGYSSLNYFSKLPISEVKFDKNFTDGLLYSKKNEVILKHFTDLSHTLGIDVVIEGVENHDQLSIIKKLACDRYQGYLYSKPLPFDKLLVLLEKNRNIKIYDGMEIS